MADDELELDERERVQERQRQADVERADELAKLRGMLDREEFRDFLWRALVKCSVFSTTFNRNFGDMAYAEGRRSVGLWLLSELSEANPDAVLAMQLKAGKLAREAERKALERAEQRRQHEATP